MAQFDPESTGPILKTYFANGRPEKAYYEDTPYFAMQKKVQASGDSYKFPVIHATTQARSNVWLTAKNKASTTKAVAFKLDWSHDYAFARVPGIDIRATRNDRGAFLKKTTMEMDGAWQAVANNIEGDLLGYGGGVRGIVGSVSGNVVTLQTPSDIRRFEVDMDLESVATANGMFGAIRAEAYNIENILDRNAGTFEVDAIGSLAAGDYLYQAGDASNAGAREPRLPGFRSWIVPPANISPTDNFFGVNRSTDKSRLAGQYLDATAGAGLNIEQAIRKMGAIVWREGGRPDEAWLSPENYAALSELIGDKVRYDRVKSPDAEVDFETIKFASGGGTIKVMTSPFMPDNFCYVRSSRYWELPTLGDMPGILMHDGNRVLRSDGSDGIEAQMGYYGTYGCRRPSANGLILLS